MSSSSSASSAAMDPRALITYYVRKGWYDHVQRLCETILEKKGSDPTIQFWRAFGIVLERSYSSAIRELDNLKKKKEVELPSLHALIYTHNQCKHVDHDEIAQLELQLVIAEENASEASQLLVGVPSRFRTNIVRGADPPLRLHAILLDRRRISFGTSRKPTKRASSSSN